MPQGAPSGARGAVAVMHNEVLDLAPMTRIGQPQEIALTILYLASTQSGFNTGEASAFDGGSVASQ